MTNALRTLLVRITSANALVPECHVEVWSDLDSMSTQFGLR